MRISDWSSDVFSSDLDICDRAALDRVFSQHRPQAVMHLAAESHVDRSIDGPAAFIETNIVGTYTLLEAARQYWMGLGEEDKRSEERRVGKECDSTCRSRWSPDH